MTPSAAARSVIAWRRGERARLVDLARVAVFGITPGIEVLAAVVVGSVARGDFHQESDVDLLIVAQPLPNDPRNRLQALGEWPAPVEPVIWTPAEYRDRRARHDLITVEAETRGEWLVGDATSAAG